MRRGHWSFVAAVLLAVCVTRARGAEGAQIGVAVSSEAPAFEDALSAFQKALGVDGHRVFLIKLDDPGGSSSPAAAKSPVVVAFGSRAAERLALTDPSVPLVTTMVLEDAMALGKSPQSVSTISLSVSPALILSKLKSAFPERRRLAVLVRPNSGPSRGSLIATAQRLGYVLEIIECASAKDVLAAFATLRGKVDFVWCLPDSVLFPAGAIPPILLASIRNELPVIGFSEGFVRAGAAVGFFPDYADIGVQTAEVVKRVLAKQDTSRMEFPRKVRMAVNDRVLRILGMDRPKLSDEVLIIR
ncbi:MAG: ABC transporter substrate binding protein [Acidobacteriota bacterium]